VHAMCDVPTQDFDSKNDAQLEAIFRQGTIDYGLPIGEGVIDTAHSGYAHTATHRCALNMLTCMNSRHQWLARLMNHATVRWARGRTFAL
jgi:hypothetical protein